MKNTRSAFWKSALDKPAQPTKRGALRLSASAIALGITGFSVLSLSTGAPAVAGPVSVDAQPIAKPVTNPPSPGKNAPAPAPAHSAAHITRVSWINDRRVAMWVYSAAMKREIPVQIMLARDWNYTPNATFPSLYLLDGMRASDQQNGWLLHTNAESFFKDKNVNLVFPIGGESSFYTDWKKPEQGKLVKWETFLTKELPPIMQESWRSNTIRGVEGPSMGGTAAMMLAARNPGFYAYAGSFSGILDITSAGMPLAVQVAMRSSGNHDSTNMFGLPSDAAWAQHDPISIANKLRGTALYVSSGNGSQGSFDVPKVKDAQEAGALGIEMLSRVTSERFATKLNQLSIPAQVVYRPSGTHSWPYWQYELAQSWNFAAANLRATAARPCDVHGAIKAAYAKNSKTLGKCITPEYGISQARAQDFTNGRIIWSPKTGGHVVNGAIGGAYLGDGGSQGNVGLPVEEKKRFGAAWIQKYTRGLIVWSPKRGSHPVYGLIADQWQKLGGVKSPLGVPAGDEVATSNSVGRVQGFDNGAMYFSQGVGVHPVIGPIYQKYAALQWEQGILGFPIEDPHPLKDGVIIQKFAGGNVYQTKKGAFVVPNGAIMNAWGSTGFERGKLGYPTSDIQIIPGGSAQSFEHGSITVVNGHVNFV